MREIVSDLKAKEKSHRSLTKAITNRALSIICDLLIVTYITGHFSESVGIIILTNLSSSIVYFFHERLWNEIKWGKTVINPIRHKIHESHSRSVTKSITYRALAIIFDITIISIIINNPPQALSIAIITNVVSTILYLIHERAWNKVHWGKHVHV